MKKVFLYLYPIEVYQRVLTFSDKYYIEHNLERPEIVLNECIKKRYIDNGYEVIIANYPDKEVFSINLENINRIINTDVTFKEASGYREDGSEKPIEEVKYPSEEFLLEQVGNVDEIVVGGFHVYDCVKRVAEHFYEKGIDTMVDLELTDLLYTVYRQSYFNKEIYNPANYKQYMIALGLRCGERLEEIHDNLNKRFGSPIYRFNDYEPTISVEEVFKDEKRGLRR